jgi:starvation-inducible DNA-binding protein
MKHDRPALPFAQESARIRIAEGNGTPAEARTPARDELPAHVGDPVPDIGLTGAQRHGSIAILNAVLSDVYVLYAKSQSCHWNVSGGDFLQLHRSFKSQYEHLAAVIDDIAERVRFLGGRPVDTLAGFLSETRLAEWTGERPTAPRMLELLLADHEAVTRQIRKDVRQCAETLKDAGTADFLTRLLLSQERTAWILRSLNTADGRSTRA